MINLCKGRREKICLNLINDDGWIYIEISYKKICKCQTLGDNCNKLLQLKTFLIYVTAAACLEDCLDFVGFCIL